MQQLPHGEIDESYKRNMCIGSLCMFYSVLSFFTRPMYYTPFHIICTL